MRAQWTRDFASLGRSPRSIILLVLVLAGHELACRRNEPKPEGRVQLEPVRPTESAATVAAVVGIDTEPTWTPEPPQPTRVVTPLIAAAPTKIPTMRPTFDIASIPNFDRPRDPTGPPGAGGTSGIGGFQIDQADFNYPVYIERLALIIGLNWFKPAQPVTANPVIHFQIERDGTIVDARVVVSSGRAFVDRAALRAVIASSPLPPLPAKYPWPHLGIQVVFD
jgi:TonB family protein